MDERILPLYARHYKTGETLPTDVISSKFAEEILKIFRSWLVRKSGKNYKRACLGVQLVYVLLKLNIFISIETSEVINHVVF